MNLLSSGGEVRRPVLVEVPPLQPLSRSSVIVTPTAIALTAIRDAMEQAAPKNLTGKRADPTPQLLSDAEIGWDITRGPLTVDRSARCAFGLDAAQRHLARHRPVLEQGRRPRAA